MENTMLQLHATFSTQMAKLENARTVLKKEYAGIETAIDQIIDNVRAWYTMPSIQERPHIINLWGLTGVGKTSLVIRLTELIGFADRTFKLDLGEKEGSLSFRDTLQDLCENKEESPIVIILDEFQHSRTIKGPFREEIESDKNRMVWELIDSGQVSYLDWKRGIWSFEDDIRKLRMLIHAGVEVENGVVIKGKELFLSEMNISENEGQPVLFIHESDYGIIIDFAGKQIKCELRSELKERLLSLDGPESIEFLTNVLRIAKRPAMKSFAQSLIFVIGNIDEAYHMSGNLTADLSADEFHERSLKISVPTIKKALRSRFRDEQIARLGNLHIIYPALSEKAYRRILDIDLEKYAKKIRSNFNVDLSFDETLKDLIYREGVYPSQGARPLLTTIQQLVKSKVSAFFNTALINNLEADHMHLNYENEQLNCEYYSNGRMIYTHSMAVTLNLEHLRKPKNDDLQVIAAVHESGHAILSAALMHSIPEYVLSVTSDPGTSGFVFSRNGKNYLSKQQMIPKVAVYMGGIVAEELIFGPEHLTAGNDQDITSATELVMNLLKRHGFGAQSILFASSKTQDTDTYHQVSAIEEQAWEIISKARELATKTLNRERKLLLLMARHLSEFPRIEKQEIRDMIEKYGTKHMNIEQDENYYRTMLFRQFKNVESHGQIIEESHIFLNKQNDPTE